MNRAEVFDHCRRFLERRQTLIEKQQRRLKESLSSETKSSAGDKHETGRALIQLEQEKLSQQVLQIQKDKRVLGRVDLKSNTNNVHLGSLVQTDRAWYFVAISADVFDNGTLRVFCMSVNAPIAKAMIGKKAGDSFVFNSISHTVLRVD